jgi:hypothetical protein
VVEKEMEIVQNVSMDLPYKKMDTVKGIVVIANIISKKVILVENAKFHVRNVPELKMVNAKLALTIIP